MNDHLSPSAKAASASLSAASLATSISPASSSSPPNTRRPATSNTASSNPSQPSSPTSPIASSATSTKAASASKPPAAPPSTASSTPAEYRSSHPSSYPSAGSRTTTFNDAQNLQNGFVQVQQGTKWITIDPQGNTVDLDKRKRKLIAPASDGVALAREEVLLCWVDSRYKLAFPLRKYDEVYSISDGLARRKLDGTYGYLDKSGNPQIPNQFANASDFNHGLADVQLPNGASAYSDPQATIVWKSPPSAEPATTRLTALLIT